MQPVAFWVPTDEPLAGRTFVYILRHKSRAQADANWAGFRADPEWVALKAETEKDGPFVKQYDLTFLKLTDFRRRCSWRLQCSAEERVKELGLELGGGPSPLGAYVEAVQMGNLLFLSGMLPVAGGRPAYVGRLGKELDAARGARRRGWPR